MAAIEKTTERAVTGVHQDTLSMRFVRLPEWSVRATMQMALDEAMMAVCRESGVPLVRFYRFEPSALSIGRNQCWSKVVDVSACQKWGLDWVRRPTGGGALLHSNEIDYSVALPLDESSTQPSLATRRRSFGVISDLLRTGLGELGVHADIHLGRDKNVGAHEGKQSIARDGVRRSHGLCSSSLTEYEISADRGKLMAAAQWMRENVILQHGTMYLFPPDENVVFWPQQTDRNGLETSVHKVGFQATLSDSITPLPSYEQVIESLKLGFPPVTDPGIDETEMANAILDAGRTLERQKYCKDDWNRRR